METKIFIGACKRSKYSTKIYLSQDDVNTIVREMKGENGWKNQEGKLMINLELKESRSGKPYIQVDTWKPGQAHESAQGSNNSQMPRKEMTTREVSRDKPDNGLPF